MTYILHTVVTDAQALIAASAWTLAGVLGFAIERVSFHGRHLL